MRDVQSLISRCSLLKTQVTVNPLKLVGPCRRILPRSCRQNIRVVSLHQPLVRRYCSGKWIHQPKNARDLIFVTYIGITKSRVNPVKSGNKVNEHVVHVDVNDLLSWECGHLVIISCECDFPNPALWLAFDAFAYVKCEAADESFPPDRLVAYAMELGSVLRTNKPPIPFTSMALKLDFTAG